MVLECALEDWLCAVGAVDDVLEQPVRQLERREVGLVVHRVRVCVHVLPRVPSCWWAELLRIARSRGSKAALLLAGSHSASAHSSQDDTLLLELDTQSRVAQSNPLPDPSSRRFAPHSLSLSLSRRTQHTAADTDAIRGAERSRCR